MRVILDCDPGNGIPGSDVDDGLAFGYLVSHPDVELLGVTVVAGNTSLEDGYRSARTMTGIVGGDIPVVAGAKRAMTEDPEKWIQRRTRKDLPEGALDVWGDVDPPGDWEAPADDDAAGFIIRMAQQYPGEVHLVAVGPLTNIALALQRRPELAQELASIYVMGGAFNVPGFLQELNFANDPEAADMVMGSGANIHLFPLDVTIETNLTLDDIGQWSTEEPMSRYMVETTIPWVRFQETYRQRIGCPLHDPLAAVALLDPGVVTMKEQLVAVDTVSPLTRSRPIMWDVSGPLLADGLTLPERRPIKVAVGVDNDRLVAALQEFFG